MTPLEDGWQDDLRRELSDNFAVLAKALGPRGLAVKGADVDDFRAEVAHRYGAAFDQAGYLAQVRPPAILVSNIPPDRIPDGGLDDESARALVFSLRERYEHGGSVSEFLRDLTEALRDPQAAEALITSDEGQLRRTWSWLRRYLDLKPGFMGMSVDLEQVIDDALGDNRT